MKKSKLNYYIQYVSVIITEPLNILQLFTIKKNIIYGYNNNCLPIKQDKTLLSFPCDGEMLIYIHGQERSIDNQLL